MIEKIYDHSIDTSLLTRGDYVLDVGARGFEFSRKCVEFGCKVLALDPDKSIPEPFLNNVTYRRFALVGTEIASAQYSSCGNAEASHIRSKTGNYDVECRTIQQLMDEYSIKKFSAVKLDCEGSEYDILLKWPGPVSNQISVEFHDFINGFFLPRNTRALELTRISRKVLALERLKES